MRIKIKKSIIEKPLTDKEERHRIYLEKKRLKEKIHGVESTRFKKGKVQGRNKGTPYKVNWEEVEKLLGLQCTLVEVASYLGVSTDTITRRCRQDHGVSFTEYRELKAPKGRVSLRRKQWMLADKSAPMAIFLGKNILGQTDKIETVNTNTNNNKVLDLSKLTDKDLDLLESVLGKAESLPDDDDYMHDDDYEVEE